MHSALEVLGGFSQSRIRHQVVTVLHLGALLQEVVLRQYVCHGLLIPVYLELGDSGFFRQNVSVESGDIWVGRRVLLHLLVVVLDINVVPNTHELLVVLVRAGKQHSCHTDNLLLRQLVHFRRISAEFEAHLPWLAVHLCFF